MSLIVPERAAPSTPSSGTVIVYAKTDGKLYAKDDAGTEWQLATSSPVAISEGGTGAVTAALARTALDVPSNAEAILDAIIAAKGDLIVGSAAGAPSIKSVGANNTIILADSAQAGGIKWGTINDLTADGSPDTAADYVMTYDASAAAHKKVLMSLIAGNSDFTFVSRATASSSAAITFTDLSGSYLVVFNNIVPATDNVQFDMTVSTDNGSNFLNSGYPYCLSNQSSNGGGVGTTSSNSDSKIRLSVNGDNLDNAASNGFSGFILLPNLNTANSAHHISVMTQYAGNSGFWQYTFGAGTYAGSSVDIDCIRFAMSSGNISTGYIDLYKLATS